MNSEDLHSWFNKYQPSFWFGKSNKEGEGAKLSGSERSLLYILGQFSSRNQTPSDNQLNWAKQIIHKFESEKSREECIHFEENIGLKSNVIRHLTVRLAWHDNGWNGKICKEPCNNTDCIGEYSLLSRRLRERKREDIEKEYANQIVDNKTVDGYQPPCYWGINAFGETDISYEHDNPAAPKIEHIYEILPKYSVFSWPFKLSFVKDEKQSRDFGKYYPPDMLDNRINYFNSKFKPKNTIVFLYNNFDNPVSGEDNKYCVVGCSYLKEIGGLSEFKISDEELKKLRTRKDGQNFPTRSWNIRYTLDLPENGMLLPYQKYLEFAEKQEGLTDNHYLDDIKVIIEESELINGFKYVAMDIDDDQAIYVLMKIRKSLLLIEEHNIIKDYDTEKAMRVIDDMLETCWKKRGHFPGIVPLTRVILGKRENEDKNIDTLFDSLINVDNENYFEDLLNIFNEQKRFDDKRNQAIFAELLDELDNNNLEINDFLKLSMLNLSYYQYKRLFKKEGIDKTLKIISDNPYLLYEEYEPDENCENLDTGDKIDGVIDLYKIDIANFPDRRYLSKIKELQTFKPDDKRRLRALLINYLEKLESFGNCYENSKVLKEILSNYPLFYKLGMELRINMDLKESDEEYRKHFDEKLVVKTTDKETFYYLKEIYEAEQYINEKINLLLNKEDINIDEEYFNIDDHINNSLNDIKVKDFDKDSFIKERKKLYTNVFKKHFYIISGSPGSGKSYEMIEIAKLFKDKKEFPVIYAPTGKAVLRIKSNEKGYQLITETIDKLLYHKDMQCGYKNVIIDEMSMVDLLKLYELFKRIDFNNLQRLIFVGDKNQLPPIGFGKPFIDSINHLKNNNYHENMISLETNCRQQTDRFIIDFAKVFSIENKSYEDAIKRVENNSQDGKVSDNLYVNYWNNREELKDKIKNQFTSIFKNRNDNLSEILDKILGLEKGTDLNSINNFKLDNFQIITPYRASYYGSTGLNLFIQEDFKEDEDFISYSDSVVLKNHDKLIRIKNYYENKELVLSNGSLGIVSKYKYFFPEVTDSYFTKIDTENIELAYAITIHKAQGSGFNHVFVIIPQKLTLLSRELLYTALTRSKTSVSLFIYKGDDENFIIDFMNKIRKKTYTENRKTSIFNEPFEECAYNPVPGVTVKSRVEYIIYKKLDEIMKAKGNFTFEYEKSMKLKNKDFTIHPDFTITLQDNKTIYWEHLGLITQSNYKYNWEKRYNLYKEYRLLDNLITTDELHGIHDEKIESVIYDIIESKIKGNTVLRYSNNHYSL